MGIEKSPILYKTVINGRLFMSNFNYFIKSMILNNYDDLKHVKITLLVIKGVDIVISLFSHYNYADFDRVTTLLPLLFGEWISQYPVLTHVWSVKSSLQPYRWCNLVQYDIWTTILWFIMSLKYPWDPSIGENQVLFKQVVSMLLNPCGLRD